MSIDNAAPANRQAYIPIPIQTHGVATTICMIHSSEGKVCGSRLTKKIFMSFIEWSQKRDLRFTLPSTFHIPHALTFFVL